MSLLPVVGIEAGRQPTVGKKLTDDSEQLNVCSRLKSPRGGEEHERSIDPKLSATLYGRALVTRVCTYTQTHTRTRTHTVSCVYAAKKAFTSLIFLLSLLFLMSSQMVVAMERDRAPPQQNILMSTNQSQAFLSVLFKDREQQHFSLLCFVFICTP